MATLRTAVQRGVLYSASAVLAVAAFVPVPAVFADALNPLTDRSLTLSSSSPGWDYKDGSGNSTYAAPNSGANGKKTGNTFDFKVSTDSISSDPVKAMTFQYCTTSAGDCMGPGDNGFTGTKGTDSVRNDDSASTSDLNVVTSSPGEVSDGDFGTIVNTSNGDVQKVVNRNDSEGNFVVYYKDGASWVRSGGWEMAASEEQMGDEVDEESTAANNQITLSNSTGQGFASGTRVKVVFFGTDNNYITNPGSGAFFVKINTYKKDTGFTADDIIDGGVTVANVMNHSINIQTKVLETMDFSVGTVDPNTLESDGAEGSQFHKATSHKKHGVCDRILTGMKPSDPVNVLKMGNKTGEDSLETDKTYSTHSYWRLSSNSSAGATVYYSGVTLSNTSGDQIEAIGPNKEEPLVGSEQFGLALANSKTDKFAVDWNMENASGAVYENGADMAANGLQGETPGIDASVATDVNGNASYHTPQLAPLVAKANYSDGAGNVTNEYNGSSNGIDTAFAFDESSNLIPVPIASEEQEVVDCVTGKMRYIANIAATTPAGIYTTKINYIAAPQY